MRTHPTTACLLVAGAGVVLSAANLAGFPIGVTGAILTAGNLLPVVAIWVAVRAYEPEHRGVWRLLLANTVLLTIGYAVFYLPAWLGGEVLPVGSVADLFWLASYPCLVAAIALVLARRESLSFALIDIAAVALALLVVVGQILIGPYLSRADLPLLTRLVMSSYALLDILVVVGCVRLLLSRGGRSGSVLLLAASSLAYVASDIGWNWTVLLGSYTEGSYLSTGWILAGGLLGAAAMVPSMRDLSTPGARRPHALSWHNAAVMGVAPLIGPVVLALHLIFPSLDEPAPATVAVVLVASALLSAVSAVRAWLLIRGGRRLAADLELALGERERRLHRSEALYRDLVEQLPGVVFVSAASGSVVQCVYISPKVESMLGLSRDSCLENARVLLDAVHPDDRDLVLQHSLGLHMGADPQPIEYRFVLPDGEVLWVREESAPRVDEVSGQRYVQGILLDITARTRAEQQRDRLDTDLRLAQKLESVGQLAAGIAHEINTPIQFVGDTVGFLEEAFGDLETLVEGYGALVADARDGGVGPDRLAEVARAEELADLDYLRERVPAAFGRARDGVGRVSHIVRAMREFAHPPTAEMAPADLNAALESTLTVTSSEYRYVADVQTELGAIPFVHCNVGDLNQAFLNLIVNAAHAIGEVVAGSDRRGTIRVATHVEGDDVVVSVHDTGGGIPPAVAERVFDPFFTTKEVGRGTGQGLAIAHRIIVERHRGALTFESRAGEGTTFEIRLPVLPPAAETRLAA